MKTGVVLGTLLGIAVLAGGLFYALQREEPAVVDTTPEEIQGTRTIELFLPDANGGVQREPREIVGSEFLEEDVRRAVEELISGGTTGIHPIPASTRLLNVFYDGAGEITLNFSEHLRTDHPGGSEAEIATVRCVVSTVGRNFPGIDRVRLLIEGETVPTLAGHLDLGRPLAVKDFR